MAGVNDPGQMGPPAVPPSWPPATPPAGPPPLPPGVPPAGLPPQPQGWVPPATASGGTPQPSGGGGKMWLGIGAVVVVLLIAGAAVFFLTRSTKPTVAANLPGKSTATPSVAATATPTPSTQSTPTPVASNGTTGGFGDTDANPDSTFICGASASTSGTVIAYTTVAGSDAAAGNTLCSALEADKSWTDISRIAASSYEAVPECYLTTSDGSVTARIYTAIPGGNVGATQTLCNTMFDSAGVTPSPGPSPTPGS
ncbi:MAG: hypothetical protein WCB51_09625 [Candidatus Dormiibacterota bacterium]